MDPTAQFAAERPRLLRLATRILDDDREAEDQVQRAWLRLSEQKEAAEPIRDIPAWLTTVTTRLCLDRLRARRAVPVAEPERVAGTGAGAAGTATPADPAEAIALADSVGVALRIVLDALSPTERVAFVLHDSFAVDFPTIAAMLECTPAAARQLASRARKKIALGPAVEPVADWEVVDAFLAAAREGRFERLLELLAPDVVVVGDAAAIATGTPERIAGREAVAEFFNGAAAAALPVFCAARPGAAWFLRGEPKVAFDFAVAGGRVVRIDFRADSQMLAGLIRRVGGVEK